MVAGRDAGGFRFGAGRGGGEPDGRALPGGVVSVFEHAVRGGVAREGTRSACAVGLLGVFEHIGAVPPVLVPGRRHRRGAPGLVGQDRGGGGVPGGSSRITGSRPGVRDPGAGNEKGSEGERGRVPAPQRDGAVAERRCVCSMELWPVEHRVSVQLSGGF